MQDLNHGELSRRSTNFTFHGGYYSAPFETYGLDITYYGWGLDGSDIYYITKHFTRSDPYCKHDYRDNGNYIENNEGRWVLQSSYPFFDNATVTSSKKLYTIQFPPIKSIVSADVNNLRFIDSHYGEYNLSKDGVLTVIQQPAPADWTVRGCVRYKEPDFVNPGDFQVAADVRNLYDIYCTLAREWKAVNIVRSNPDMHTAKQYRLAPPAVFDMYLANKSTEIKSGEAPEAIHFNNLKTGINDSFNMSVPIVYPGDDVYANMQNQLISALRAMSTTLNTYNNYWDNNDYCALSCQVACQASCMLACQSCHGGTCHDQNCGGWS